MVGGDEVFALLTHVVLPGVVRVQAQGQAPPCPPDCPSMVPAVGVAIAIVGAVLLVIAALASFLRRSMRSSPAPQSAASDWRYVEYLANLEELKTRGEISEKKLSEAQERVSEQAGARRKTISRIGASSCNCQGSQSSAS